jgi:hypothetical protein
MVQIGNFIWVTTQKFVTKLGDFVWLYDYFKKPVDRIKELFGGNSFLSEADLLSG